MLTLLRQLDGQASDLLISTAEHLIANDEKQRAAAMPANVYLLCDPLRKFT